MSSRLEAFLRKKIVPYSQLSRVNAQFSADSFFSAGVESEVILAKMKTMIADYLAQSRNENGTLKVGSDTDFVHWMRRWFESQGLLTNPSDDSMSNITAPTRLRLIFDTQVAMAYGQARYEREMSPSSLERYPYWRFIRIPGAKVKRPLHAQNEGRVELKTSPFWVEMNDPSIGGFGLPYAPFGFNSYMDTEEVSVAEARELGLPIPQKPQDPEQERKKIDRAKSSLIGLPPDVRKALIERMKKRGINVSEVEEGVYEPTFSTTKLIPDDPQSNGKNESRPKLPTQIPIVPSKDTTPKAEPVAPSPMSEKLDVTMRTPKEQSEIERALEIIDSVHSDGPLPKIVLHDIPPQGAPPNATGAYSYSEQKSDFIFVRQDNPEQMFTTVHEVGHFLDKRGIPDDCREELGAIIDSAKQTESFISMKERLERDRNYLYLKYLNTNSETFARLYSQFIAEKSNDEDLLFMLKKRIFTHWSTNDFAFIKEKLEQLFKSLSWM